MSETTPDPTVQTGDVEGDVNVEAPTEGDKSDPEGDDGEDNA